MNSYLCIKAKKCIFSSESGFFSRGEDKRYFLAKVHNKFFIDHTNYKAKDIIRKITNFFCIQFY
jgi:hypothetical protein